MNCYTIPVYCSWAHAWQLYSSIGANHVYTHKYPNCCCNSHQHCNNLYMFHYYREYFQRRARRTVRPPLYRTKKNVLLNTQTCNLQLTQHVPTIASFVRIYTMLYFVSTFHNPVLNILTLNDFK